ncbi:hypothetical protein E1301_Tti020312 [Triplophysa tibetana]|uniref:Uncharacterized protein n=1 Tax=Triplophysa tibetana TaxID=1572043 RepID=A0A5A9NWI3_9TELE|nr:hypothetical protein E1301_Tti020312 [Triplophysa tibetana]
MTKIGKSSAYWNDVCQRYAQGTFQFSTGKRPGTRKWKEVLERIDACPLQWGNKVDLFGRHIACTCGFHKSTDKALIEAGPNAEAGSSLEEAGTSQGEQGRAVTAVGPGSRVLLDFSNTLSPAIMGPYWLHVSALQKICIISTAAAASATLAVSTASTSVSIRVSISIPMPLYSSTTFTSRALSISTAHSILTPSTLTASPTNSTSGCY